MQFELWSVWHFLYIFSPFVFLGILYLLLKNRSQTTKRVIGIMIGLISIGILIMRNVDITINNGFDPQAIPLQVCHFGNILVFIALIFKNKTAAALAFCFSMPFAFASLIEATVLANYSSVLVIRAQAYIWGHLLIIVGAVYPVLLNTIKFKLRNVFKGIFVLSIIFVIAMLMNLLLNGLGWNINYFYAFDSGGVPFNFLENLIPKLDLVIVYTSELFVSWDYMYTICMAGIGLFINFIMYLFSRVIYKLGKSKQVGNGIKS